MELETRTKKPSVGVGVGYGYFLEYCKTREPQKLSAFQGAWLTLQP